MDAKKLTLMTDFYELTMANGYFKDNRKDEIAVFDVFFRRVPDGGGYAIFAGLEQVIEYIQNLKFDQDEIKYLKSKNMFDEGFLKYLENFKFTCDVFAMKEGSAIFPNEPILIVRGPIIECQLIETMILLTINHQSLIATKASRIVKEAKGRLVMEFGARRAHGGDAALYGARAAYIGGVAGTSNTLADYKFGIPALGTMAHSYVQSFEDEYDAFKSYALNYPDNTVLLIDTYDTLNDGLPNAIRVHNEILKPMGKYLKGVRIDSGDLAYLTKKVREILDENGLEETKITVSNALDEYLIRDLVTVQEAKIDSFGVGERLITARSEAVFGGVYKLAALKKGDEYMPKIKLSNNASKTTIPGFKQVYRFYDEENKAIADVITLHDEIINPNEPYLLFDPVYPWKQKLVTNFTVKKLLIPIFEKGKLVYDIPKLSEVKAYAQEERSTLWKEVLRLERPHQYYVDLSQPLWDLREQLIATYRKK
ncbi:MAG: nicotinate phosphoribosyltransferase [Candidatus Phytoplasma sp.]|nr:nicotinate phosphoribosyltransferase [Phytoplasma sp.]